MKNILMNVEMTKAILDGRKVQTRRVFPFEIETEQDGDIANNEQWVNEFVVVKKEQRYDFHNLGKYQKGETIWVREPARIRMFKYYMGNHEHRKYEHTYKYEYLADNKIIDDVIPVRFSENPPNWMKSCQGIPNGCIKEMARIFLKITNVRVERLQDITFQDICSEGCELIYKRDFKSLEDKWFSIRLWWVDIWNKTAPKGYKWEDNPYVFVYEFERVEG